MRREKNVAARYLGKRKDPLNPRSRQFCSRLSIYLITNDKLCHFTIACLPKLAEPTDRLLSCSLRIAQ